MGHLALRDVFEQHNRFYSSSAVQEIYVLSAAQYILYEGQHIFQHIIYPGDVSSLDEQHWDPGPRYLGSARLNMSRWRYWRGGFLAEVESRTASDEVRAVAGKAVSLMDALKEANFDCPRS